MSGTKKLTPSMIGKFTKPRFFKGRKYFSVIYIANKKTWITSEFFADRLKQINNNLCKKKIRIIFSWAIECIILEIKALKVVFLPTNTTSKLQSLDQWIIRSFKVWYKRAVVKNIVVAIDRKEEITQLNILECMRIADRGRA